MQSDYFHEPRPKHPFEFFTWVQFAYTLSLATAAIAVDCISCRSKDWFLGLWIVYVVYGTFAIVMIRLPKSLTQGLWVSLSVPLQLIITSLIFSWPLSFSIVELVVMEIVGIFGAAFVVALVILFGFLAKGQFLSALSIIPGVALFIGLFWVVYIVYEPVIVPQYQSIGSNAWWLLIPYLTSIYNHFIPIKNISIIASKEEQDSYRSENFIFSKFSATMIYTAFLALWFFESIALLSIFCPTHH